MSPKSKKIKRKSIFRNILFISFFLNLLLFTFTYLIYTPQFLTNDDVKMMLRVAGLNRVLEPSSFIHSNIILGNVLSSLYSFNTRVPWYILYMIFGFFVSHVAFLYRMLKNSPFLSTMVLYLVYFVLIGLNLLINLQFTILGGVLTFSGIALIFFEQQQKKTNKRSQPSSILKEIFTPKNCIGILLILFGSLVRWHSMLLVVALFSPILFIQYFSKPIREIKLKGLLLLIALLTCYGALKYEHYVYNQHPGWKSHLEKVPSLVKFIDYRILETTPVEERVKILSSVDWSVNDYYMLLFWFSMNEELYNKSNFDKILNQAPSIKTNVTLEKTYETLKEIFATQVALNCFLIWLFICITLRLTRNKLLQLLAAFLLPILIILYLVYFRKAPPPRVWYVILAFLAWVPLLLINKKYRPTPSKFKSYKKIGLFVILALTLCYSANMLYTYRVISNNRIANNLLFKSTIQKFNPSLDNLYVIWGQGFSYELILPFDNLDYIRNFQTIGVGVPPTPTTKQVLEKYGVEDVYMDLIEKDNVFLCLHPSHEKRLNMFNTYMIEHYQRPIQFKRVFEFGIFNVYKIL